MRWLGEGAMVSRCRAVEYDEATSTIGVARFDTRGYCFIQNSYINWSIHQIQHSSRHSGFTCTAPHCTPVKQRASPNDSLRLHSLDSLSGPGSLTGSSLDWMSCSLKRPVLQQNDLQQKPDLVDCRHTKMSRETLAARVISSYISYASPTSCGHA
jgi:hypothetical protein